MILKHTSRLTAALLTLIILSAAACTRDARKQAVDTSVPLPDTLRVATLYSPTSYFIYRETAMGYDYDMISRFTADKKITLKLEVMPSLSAAIENLDSGLVDLIAYEVPVTAEYLRHIVPAGNETVTHQVLVQPKQSAAGRVTDVTQLVGREVYVEKDSKYHQRLINLDRELGGGIIIRPIDRDTLITEDLIAMVSSGELPLTVVDSDIARINKTYYPDLDITLEISFEQRAAWGVSPDKRWLADSINAWSHEEKPRLRQAELLKQYFEMSKRGASIAGVMDFSHGRISPFDYLFRQYASKIGWDWRLLASQGYVESHFDSTLVSWAGARGVMQLMPSTARANGLSDDKITHNEPNIATAVKIIASLEKTFRGRVSDPEERRKFVIAAYNSGAAHILDAIALAGKYGYRPDIWDGNVEAALMLKAKPEYYNDPVCKFGYFRGTQTREYVQQVYAFYHRAQSRIPR